MLNALNSIFQILCICLAVKYFGQDNLIVAGVWLILYIISSLATLFTIGYFNEVPDHMV